MMMLLLLLTCEERRGRRGGGRIFWRVTVSFQGWQAVVYVEGNVERVRKRLDIDG
jgi:hypothetical protein